MTYLPTPAAPVDVATATQRVSGPVRTRMENGRSYLMAICDERDIVAQCIADYALSGREPYIEWLEEYFVLCQMRDANLRSFSQERGIR